MRILHVLDHGPPMHSGYAFRTAAMLAAQAALGWRVRAVTGARHIADGPDPEFFDEVAHHRSSRVPPGRSPLREWRELRALSEAVGQVARAWRPDVIHAHSPVLNALAAAPVARKLGLPFVYEVRALWEDLVVATGAGREGDGRYRLTRAVETRAAEGADALVAASEGLRGDLARRGVPRAKITVVPPGVDPRLFGRPAARSAELARAMGLGADDEVVGYVGSLRAYEGVDLLIDAMPSLVERRPKLSLLLVGGGPDEAALRARAAASAVRSRIHFTGLVPHRDVPALYGLVDALAYPRRRMRHTDLVAPLKPLEAMASGKPVAASDVGGHRELIRDGNTGTLFPAGDVGAMVDAVAGLFSEPANGRTRREAARRFVEAEGNWSSNVRIYRPTYDMLLDRIRR